MTIKVDGTNGVLQAYDYQAPTTGFTYNFTSGTQTLVLNPAGTLATGTINMPASPADGMVITFSTTQQITALTVGLTSPQTMTSAPTFMDAGSSASYVYNLANTAWRPLNNVPQILNVPVGVGQTWTDVIASRANNTTYTNSTGRPIVVQVWVGQNGGNASASLTVSGVTNVSYWGSTTSVGLQEILSAVVPSGGTYSVQGSVYLINGWKELR